jgi:thiamine pyrophosphate-dependent acetolactate synthase large subunit-like protein
MSTMIGAVCYKWAALSTEHPRNCILSLMGFGIGLATGIALALPYPKIVCIDGDGSILLKLGQLVLLGQERPRNLVIIVVDNGAYESIGTTKGAHPRPTATAANADFAAIALGAGVPYAKSVETMKDLERELVLAFSGMECRFINVRTKVVLRAIRFELPLMGHQSSITDVPSTMTVLESLPITPDCTHVSAARGKGAA